MVTTNSTVLAIPLPQSKYSSRDVAELAVGFLAILAVLWLPSREQLIFGPLALLAPLAMVVSRRPSLDQLGLGWRGLASAWWILPAASGLAVLGIVVAQEIGTFHPLYAPDFSHVGGYVVWTIYQQFLLQDYFMPRLARVLNGDWAITVAASLFALAHLPNVPLTIATLVWGVVSCLLFRRYRSLYFLGIAQGLLGLCFALCVPDVWLHHMRVGLGYYHYHPLAQGSAYPPAR